jgi:cell division protein FtsB
MKNKKKMRFGILIIVAFLIYFSYITVEQQNILKNKEDELSSIQKIYNEEKKLQLKLDEQFQIVSTQEYIEKAARQKLGLVKEGERVFVDTNK